MDKDTTAVATTAGTTPTGPLSARNFKELMQSSAIIQKVRDVVPKHMDVERLMRVTMLAVSRSQKLLECTPDSLLRAFMDASQLGLDCTGSLGEAYLIPYYNGKTKCHEATMIPGYRGLISLARRSGEIDDVHAHPVYENDDFEISLGSNPSVTHHPCLTDEKGELLGFYAVARLKGGGIIPDYMTKGDVDKIREKSKAPNSLMWTEHYNEGGRKTIFRRLSKYLPLSPEAKDAITVADQNEYGGAFAQAAPTMITDERKKEMDAAAPGTELSEMMSLARDWGIEKSEVEAKSKDRFNGKMPASLTSEEVGILLGLLEEKATEAAMKAEEGKDADNDQ